MTIFPTLLCTASLKKAPLSGGAPGIARYREHPPKGAKRIVFLLITSYPTRALGIKNKRKKNKRIMLVPLKWRHLGSIASILITSNCLSDYKLQN